MAQAKPFIKSEIVGCTSPYVKRKELEFWEFDIFSTKRKVIILLEVFPNPAFKISVAVIAIKWRSKYRFGMIAKYFFYILHSSDMFQLTGNYASVFSCTYNLAINELFCFI
jgi:hypothetical protein